jgi:hypothetical protein
MEDIPHSLMKDSVGKGFKFTRREGAAHLSRPQCIYIGVPPLENYLLLYVEQDLTMLYFAL